MAEELNWLHEDQARHLIKEVTDFAGLGPEFDGELFSIREGNTIAVTIFIGPKKVLDNTPD